MTTSSPLPELPAIGFLADLDSNHRAFLASYGKFVRPADGDLVIEEGKPQDSIYLIMSGVLHVVSAAGGRNLLVATLGAGDSFGEINVFDPAMASASVIARSGCLVWRVSEDELADFFAADPVAGIEFMKGLLQLTGHRIRAMNAKLANAEEKSALHRFWMPSA